MSRQRSQSFSVLSSKEEGRKRASTRLESVQFDPKQLLKDMKRIEKLREEEKKRLQKLAAQERKAREKVEKERKKELKSMEKRLGTLKGKDSKRLSEQAKQMLKERPPEAELNFIFESVLKGLDLDEKTKQELHNMSIESRWLFIVQHKATVELDSSFASLEEPAFYVRRLEADPDNSVLQQLNLALGTADDNWYIGFQKKRGLNVLLGLLLVENQKVEHDKQRIRLLVEGLTKLVTGHSHGLTVVLNTESAVNTLVLCTTGADPPTKTALFEILAALSQVSDDGFWKVLHAFAYHKYKRREKFMFQNLVEILHFEEDIELKVAAMTLVNCFCNIPENLDQRVEIRNQFEKQGLGRLISRLRQFAGHQNLRTQLDVYVDDAMADVKEDAERFENAQVDPTSSVQMAAFLEKNIESTPIRRHYLNVMKQMVMLPRTQDTYGLWSVLDRVVSQIASRRNELMLSHDIALDLDQILLAIDDKIQMDIMRQKLREIEGLHRHQLASLNERYEEKLQRYRLNQGATSKLSGSEDTPVPHLGRKKVAGTVIVRKGGVSSAVDEELKYLRKRNEELQIQLDDLRKENMSISKRSLSASLSPHIVFPATDSLPPTPGAGVADLPELPSTPASALRAISATAAAENALEPPPDAPQRTQSLPAVPSGGGAPPPPPPPGGAGGPGPPPPPPPGGFGGPGGGGKVYSKQPKPSVKMKMLNWDKIPPSKVDKTIFQECNQLTPEERDEVIEFDYSKIEEMFQRKKIEKKEKRDSAKAVSIISPKRAQNVAIFLSTFAIKTPVQIRDSIDHLTLRSLHPSAIVKLMDNVPTAEEFDQCRLYIHGGGDRRMLGPAETFFLLIGELDHVQDRLNCIQFCVKTPEICEDLAADLQKVELACKDLRTSKRFHRLLRVMLELGNFINAGGPRGNAGGFKLSSLPKLKDVKDQKGRITLFDFLILLVREKWPDLRDWGADLTHVHEAARISMSTITSEYGTLRGEMLVVSRQMEDLTHGKKKLPEENKWHEVMPSWFDETKVEIEAMRDVHDRAMHEFYEILDLFAEDAKTNSEDFFGQISKFIIIWEIENKKIELKLEEERQAELRVKKKEESELNAMQNAAASALAARQKASMAGHAAAIALQMRRKGILGDDDGEDGAGTSSAMQKIEEITQGLRAGTSFKRRREARQAKKSNLANVVDDIRSKCLECKVVIDTRTGNMWAKDLAPGNETPLIFIGPRDQMDAKTKSICKVSLHSRLDGKTSGKVIEIVKEP